MCSSKHKWFQTRALSEVNDWFNFADSASSRSAHRTCHVRYWKIHLPHRLARILHKDKSVNVILLIRPLTRGLPCLAHRWQKCAISVSALPLLDFAPTVAIELILKLLCLSLNLRSSAQPKFVDLRVKNGAFKRARARLRQVLRRKTHNGKHGSFVSSHKLVKFFKIKLTYLILWSNTVLLKNLFLLIEKWYASNACASKCL